MSPGYIEGILKALKSWLRYNDVRLTRKISVKDAGRTPTIEDEQVPSRDELARIFRVSTPRARTAEAFLALADLRPETLGKHHGNDGLMLRDLPDLRIEGGKVAFKKIPAMIVVRPPLSKHKHKYFTFLGEEGCTYLAEYLEARMREGEKLTTESPIIGHETERSQKNKFITTTKIGDLIRQAMRKAGVRKRPYVLRAYAETQLIIAESKGKISHAYLQFIAGHKGDIEARYSTNKGRLPPEMVEGMREAYERSLEFLQTTSTETPNEEKVRESFRKQLLLVAGFKQDEIDKVDVLGIDDEAFKNMVKQRLLGDMVNNGSTQKVVDQRDVEKHIKEGWEFVASLSEDKVIMRIPH
jgi:hypothetical protein